LDDECRSKRECLLLQELRALRDERDSLLNREEDRSRLLSDEISKFSREAECWKKKHDDVLSELQDLNKERDSLRSERAIVLNKQKGALRVQDDVEKEEEAGRNLLLQQANDSQAFNSRSDYLEELHNVRNEWTSLMKMLDDQTQTRVRTDDLREQRILQPNQTIQVAEFESNSLCTRINELNEYLLRGAEQSIRKIRTLESESESLRTVIGELRQQLDRQAEEATGKIQAPSSEFESLHSKMHDLHQQLNEANGSEQKVQKAHSESPLCVSKLQQENLDLHQRCSQLSSELSKLKAKMQFCSSSLSGSSEKESNLKMVKHEEMSYDSLKKQFVSEMEKARNAKQALLNKLNTLKKSYRSLRKQYSVLFRRTHTMESHHKDAVFLSANGRKYHCIDRAETENGTHTNDGKFSDSVFLTSYLI
jgi:predicted  nucleic acid-binding Zn-ribbon protein